MVEAKILKKAKRLVKGNKIRIEQMGTKRIRFIVTGDTREHMVFFFKDENKWSCDCEYSAIHPQPDCSHRLACKLLGDKMAYNGDAQLWSPDLKFTPMSQAMPSKTLLVSALARIGLKGFEVSEDSKLSDDYGVFAYNLKDFVLVAKDYVMGNCVSAHKRAVISAHNQNKPLVMYLNEQEKFYRFETGEILRKNYGENFKGTALMLNWSIILGKPLKTENIMQGILWKQIR